METRQRTIVKAVLWTLLGVVVMLLVGLVFTGSLVIGGGIAVVNAVTGFLFYLIYERLWSHVRWGRQ